MNWNSIQQEITPTINDIVFANDRHQRTILQVVSNRKPFPAGNKNGILLHGLHGTGKSALAMLLPSAIEVSRGGGEAYERIFHIKPGQNGADIIQKIDAQAQLIPAATHQYFVLDEVDNLTNVAMKSLKSIMNTSNAVFILTTNNFDKIEEGIISRCHDIPFQEAPAEKWLPLAHKLLELGEVSNVNDSDLINVIVTCRGSARDIIDALIDFVIAWRERRGLPYIPQS